MFISIRKSVVIKQSLYLAWMATSLSQTVFGQSLEESAKRQAALTSTKTLANGIIFVQREIPGSDIAHLEVNIPSGQQDLPEDKRELTAFAFDVMPTGSKSFSKDKIFALTEKLSINLRCAGGIEQSGCQVETVSENLDTALKLLASVVTEPSFHKQDVELLRQRRTAEQQAERQNPEQHVNSLVNTIFYPVGHPYRHLPDDAIQQVAKLTADDLKSYHKSILNGQDMQIIYAGPKLSAAIDKKIVAAFAKLPKNPRKKLIPPPPAYDPKVVHAFEHRPIPTAYIRAKFNAPGASSKDAAASRVLFEIMSEELHEDIRTKRSLSYAIGAMTLQLEEGIGVVSASTSKPRETIDAMHTVLKRIRDTTFTEAKLAEYKNVFTTTYYLTLETHDSLASALSHALFHLGAADRLYELPMRIQAVTSADVQRIARDILKHMRVGVIYDKDKFMPEWVDPITKL